MVNQYQFRDIYYRFIDLKRAVFPILIINSVKTKVFEAIILKIIPESANLKMRVAFFQAAMLAVAVTAADEEQSYFPDLLVQTASIVDYFYPFNHDEE